MGIASISRWFLNYPSIGRFRKTRSLGIKAFPNGQMIKALPKGQKACRKETLATPLVLSARKLPTPQIINSEKLRLGEAL
jgi:hypothetical protein